MYSQSVCSAYVSMYCKGSLLEQLIEQSWVVKHWLSVGCRGSCSAHKDPSEITIRHRVPGGFLGSWQSSVHVGKVFTSEGCQSRQQGGRCSHQQEPETDGRQQWFSLDPISGTQMEWMAHSVRWDLSPHLTLPGNASKAYP